METEKKTEEPKIDVNIVSKEEHLWTELKKRTETSLETLNKELIINKAVLELCDSKIKAEQVKE